LEGKRPAMYLADEIKSMDTTFVGYQSICNDARILECFVNDPPDPNVIPLPFIQLFQHHTQIGPRTTNDTSS
jgi:hypothetical protein